jgi:multidrug efflux pump
LRRVIRFSAVALLVYVGLLGVTWLGFRAVPTGFVPTQDKGYLIVFTQLPDSASLERTREVLLRCGADARSIPGVTHSVEFPGFSLITGGNSPNAGTMFLGLEPFDERQTPEKSVESIIGQLYQKFGGVTEGLVLVFPPPAVNGLGSVGGFKLQIQDRSGAGIDALNGVAFQVMMEASQNPKLQRVFTTLRANAPQLYADVDRVKAKTMGVSLSEIFETLQIYLGSLYVNDFNRFGRTYQVTAQADARFRMQPEDIGKLKTRNAAGDMVPLSTLVTVNNVTGPDFVTHYNLFPSADMNGGGAPGVSSGEAISEIEGILKKVLPQGMSYEWTELTLQEIMAGSTALFIFPLCVLLVFLTLAAQYESWSLPLAIILIVPMCLLSAIAGVWFRGMDNNLFTQIGFVVLVGLACKNAILIVEFAKEKEEAGETPFDAAVEAARLRLRPILMTSFAFILGVLPMAFATGAGSEMRQALGTAVFSGMIGVTFFGIFLTPVFYVVIRQLLGRRKKPVSVSTVP